MPPKRSRGASSKITKKNKVYTSISVQTEDYCNEEVLNYQKQIQLLQKELSDCKQQITVLQTENKVLRDININALKITSDKDNEKISLMGRNTLIKARKDRVSSPVSGTKISKGCSCKGNCSNKICGCVKKGIPCQEFCRCNDAQCKNQEPEKENINTEQVELSNDGQKALEKLGLLTLSQEERHASEKKAKRSMFSPFGFRNGIANGENYPASPLSIETRRKLFSEDADAIVDIDTNTDQESPTLLDHKGNSDNLKKPQIQFCYTPVAKRTRRLRSAEKESKSIVINNKTEHLKVFEATSVIDKENVQVLQQTLQPDIDSESAQQSHPPGIIITNSFNERKENILAEKLPEHVHEKIASSPRALRKKSKSVSPEHSTRQRKCSSGKEATNIKCKSMSPEESHVTQRKHKNDQPCLGRVQHSPQPVHNYVKLIPDDQNITMNTNNKEIQSTQIQLTAVTDTNTLSVQSNTSGSSSSSNQDVLDISLNPMVPKRQLPRSPINAAGTLIAPLEKKRFSPPKKELAVAEIDWEQHQSKLIMCKRCKRKFFPHRIDIHMISCKGI